MSKRTLARLERAAMRWAKIAVVIIGRPYNETLELLRACAAHAAAKRKRRKP
jgi:hypothetical protein